MSEFSERIMRHEGCFKDRIVSRQPKEEGVLMRFYCLYCCALFKENVQSCLVCGYLTIHPIQINIQHSMKERMQGGEHNMR